jgi:hypothetical protein
MDPDPDPDSESGSTDLIEYGSETLKTRVSFYLAFLDSFS